MKFSEVDLTKQSNIRYALRRWEQTGPPGLSILHVAFSGDSRTGVRGADAHFIDGIVDIATGVWHPSGLILDLGGLQYEWGKEMSLVLKRQADRLAIIINPQCVAAFSESLDRGKRRKSILKEPHIFDAFDPALEYVTQQVANTWNRFAKESAGRTRQVDPVSVEQLRGDG